MFLEINLFTGEIDLMGSYGNCEKADLSCECFLSEFHNGRLVNLDGL